MTRFNNSLTKVRNNRKELGLTFLEAYPIITVLQILPIVWGIWVLLPFAAFVGPNFALMLSIIGEFWWGMCALHLGVFGTFAMATGQVWTAKIILVVSALFWFALASCFLIISTSTGVPTYLALGLLWLGMAYLIK